MKTLYITDLDGTLLDDTPKTSEYTNNAINKLISQGAVISYATARSFVTAKKVTTGLNYKYPLVVHNGTFIVDKDGKILVKNVFDKNDAIHILNTILKCRISPIVFSLVDGQQKFSYLKNNLNKPTQDFINNRLCDPRNRPLSNVDELFDGEIYYFTLIGEEQKTQPLHNLFKSSYQCYFQRDMYSGEYWLEITPKSATKANAVKQLANILNCEKIVAFGDGINDIGMFELSDECYAVANAEDILKQKATKVIGSNLEDAVAKWLEKNITK